MVERHPITDRESWLALRRQDVTASVVGALFGVHPYESALGLYLDKSGIEIDRRREREASLEDVLERGRIYEPVVAAMAAVKHPNWRILPAKEYLRDPEIQLGASPDFYVESDDGRGVLQVKTVTPRAAKTHWSDGPPFWIQLQTLTEMLLDGASWGAVACWVIDPYRRPDVEFFPVPRHPAAEDRIRAATASFWADMAAGNAPGPDYKQDAALLAALCPATVTAKAIDLSGDNRLPALLVERAAIKETIGIHETRVKEIETEVRHKMGDAEIARLPGWYLTMKDITRKAHTVKETTFKQLRVTSIAENEV